MNSLLKRRPHEIFSPTNIESLFCTIFLFISTCRKKCREQPSQKVFSQKNSPGKFAEKVFLFFFIFWPPYQGATTSCAPVNHITPQSIFLFFFQESPHLALPKSTRVFFYLLLCYFSACYSQSQFLLVVFFSTENSYCPPLVPPLPTPKALRIIWLVHLPV